MPPPHFYPTTVSQHDTPGERSVVRQVEEVGHPTCAAACRRSETQLGEQAWRLVESEQVHRLAVPCTPVWTVAAREAVQLAVQLTVRVETQLTARLASRQGCNCHASRQQRQAWGPTESEQVCQPAAP